MQKDFTKNETFKTLQKEADRQTARRKILSSSVKFLLSAGLGFLFGTAEFPFATNPIGIAYLCATEQIPAALLGLLLSGVLAGKDLVIRISAYVSAGIICIFGKFLTENAGKNKKENPPLLKRIFDPSTSLRVSAAALCTLLLSLFRVISGGFAFYDFFAMAFSTIFAPVATVFFSVLQRKDTFQSEPHLLLVSQGVCLFLAMWSTKTLPFFPSEIGIVASLFITISVSRFKDFRYGLSAGILSGLSLDPKIIPAFVIACLLYESMRKKGSEGSGIFLGILSSYVWLIYIEGAAFLFDRLVCCLLAGTLLTLLGNLETRKKEEKKRGEWIPDPNLEIAELQRLRKVGETRVTALSEAYANLSEMFYRISSRMQRPDTAKLSEICESAMEEYCPECPRSKVCEREKNAEFLTTSLYKNGKIAKEAVQTEPISECSAGEKLIERINQTYTNFSEKNIRNNRTEILAMDFEAASSQMEDVLEDLRREESDFPEIEERIGKYLQDTGIRCPKVRVSGERKKEIRLFACKKKISEDEIKILQTELEELLSLKLSLAEEDSQDLVFHAEEKFRIELAKRNISREENRISGDSVHSFRTEDGRFFALICDGMGSGREAALTSNLSSAFLERMLTSGGHAKSSLRMLNNLLLSKRPDSSSECSCTVDLMETDLYSGKTSFLKSGAAPCFVIRGNALHRLQSENAPIGILRQTDGNRTDFQLRKGDVVVMISDGILENDPDETWLKQFLFEASESTPDEIARKISRHATAYPSHDDCSVIALKVVLN